VAKEDANKPGAKGADEEGKLEQEAAESKAAASEEKPKRSRAKKADAPKAASEEKPKRSRAKKADTPEAAEEKPKPKPRRAAAKKDAAEEAKQQEAADEAEAEAAEADGEPAPEDEQAKPKSGGRRGGAAAAGRSRRATPARRAPDGDVTVRARAKYVRCAPRKARLVIDHIRGKQVDEARALLLHTPRAASRDVLKLLESAIANAENNHELVADELRVGKAYVDEGPTLKRYRPRALGRATRIRKRTSHLTIELVAKE
jgi:ribosomal protein L22